MLSYSTPASGGKTCTSNVNETLPGKGTLRLSQTIVFPETEPPLLIERGLANPLGNTSVTSTPVASAGPSLVTNTVKVTNSETVGTGLSTILIRLKSAVCLRPKSIVMLPLSSSIPSSFPPLSNGSLVLSVSACKLNTPEVIVPSVTPSPSVSCWIPLSSPSTSLSAVCPPVEDTGEVAGGVNSIK